MLHEKWRPRTWADVVGQPKAVATLQLLVKAPGGRAIWIQGPSGSGKTTLAHLYAESFCDTCSIEEYDAGELTPAAIREIERRVSVRGFCAGGRAVIVNEAHGLRKDTIRALLVALERIPSHVAWLFTTTCDGAESLFEDCDDGSPLLSRCIPIALARRGVNPAYAARAKAIAEAEGLDGRPIAEYVSLLNDCRQNLRMAISRIEAGCMLVEAGQ